MNSRQGDEQHRIVVGVDGFGSSGAALRWAIGQAKLTGAVVEAVTAWHGHSAGDLRPARIGACDRCTPGGRPVDWYP